MPILAALARRSIALAGILTPLLGCAVNAGGEGSLEDPTSAHAPPSGAGHAWIAPAAEGMTSRGPTLSTSSGWSGTFTYYGGKVVSGMRVVQVLWGTGSFDAHVTSTAVPSMASFYQGILTSAYVDWLSEYSTPTQSIGRGGFDGQYTITPSTTATKLDDTVIAAELAKQIDAGKLPPPTLDAKGNSTTYYAIFFPHGDVITQGKGTSCRSGGFCAYHGTVAATAKRAEIYYGVHPDMQPGSGCDLGCGAGPTLFDNQTATASHEVMETITDPEVGLATSYAAPLGWYNMSGGEIGDVCTGNTGQIDGHDGAKYTVQAVWSNASHACLVTAPTDFSLSLATPSATIAAGATATSVVSTSLLSGLTAPISLSVTGAPAGTTASLLTPSLTVGGGTTLKVVTTASTPAGNYTLTVSGAAAGRTHTATFALSVYAPLVITAPSTIALGTGGTTTVNVGVSGGGAPSNLSVTGLPYGVSASFASPTVSPGSSTTLTLTAIAGATQGNAKLTIGATTSTGVSSSAVSTLSVTGSSFGLSTSASSLTIAAGASGTATLTTTVATGAPEPVNLVVSGLPPGVTASLKPATVTSGATSQLQLNVSSAAFCGTTKVTVTGSAASGPAKAVTIALTITGNDFSLTPSVAALTVSRGKSTTLTVKSALVSGKAQPIALTADGLPPGVTASFAPASINTGDTSTVTISVAATGATPGGPWTLSLIGTGTNAMHVAAPTLTIK
jgi:hypothetical protein